MCEIYYNDLLPNIAVCLEIEFTFETMQQIRINLMLLYDAIVYTYGQNTNRNPFINAGIVYNTQCLQNRCENEWVFR